MIRSTLIALAAGLVAVGCGTDPEGNSDLELSTTTWDFGSVVIGARSVPLRITVTNSGSGETGPLTVTLGGGSPDEFSLTSDECSGHDLSGGSACVIDVELIPASFGTREAVLTVADARGQRAAASLRGSGSAAGSGFTVTPVLGNFGETRAGQTGATKTFLVQNGTRSNTGAMAVRIEGAGATSYRITRDLCSENDLGPAAFCAVDVQFVPAQAGTYQATLVVAGAATTRQAQLVGSSGAPATLTASPSGPIAFESQIVGHAGPISSIFITNSGASSTGALIIELSGPNTSDYQVSSSDCYPVLGAAAVCEIDVQFAPTAVGTRTASVEITDPFGTHLSIPLSGEALPVPPPPTPLTMTPGGSFTFAPTLVGASASRSVTVTNPGPGASGPLQTSLTHCYYDFYYGDYCLPVPHFELSLDTCNGVDLPAGASCTVLVTFRPTSFGPYVATFNASAPSRTGTISLDGSGVGLHPSTSNLVLPSVPIGAVSEPQAVVITNAGTTTTGPIDTEISGFVFEIVSDACEGVSLTAGAACTISVRFKPVSEGDRVGTLGVTANPGGTLMISLTGTTQ